MAERVRVREIDDNEGRRWLQVVRRGTGSVVTWRRAQMVLPSEQGMAVANNAEVTFTSADRARDVIHNFNTDGFASLYPKYKGGRPKSFTLPERRETKKMAKSKLAEHGLPFSTWSLVKLADFLVVEGVIDDISHEGLRILLREEGVSFQCVKTWKSSKDPDYAAKKARVEHLYAIADGEVTPDGRTRSHFLHGRVRAAQPPAPPRTPVGRTRRATYTGPHGVRHLFAAYNLGKDQLYGHIKKTKNHSKFLEFCRYLRSLHPARKRIATVCDNYSPHLTTKRSGDGLGRGQQCRDRLHPDEFILAQPHRGQSTALRYFTLDGTDHTSHKEQGSMIRRYIIWRNRHANDNHLRKIVAKANVA
ncbi:IS630 family transposase [Streptomyces katrae]|uniref:IS630 family transposase n=1 Tax=Streptomyces katrae TaxID=68223 RepID=A0ABT7H5Y5_9ACTN|nr:IS630 family transposase [Streptomyces katrae]MDK9501309.1 IS630 family transposase [Streptomyces katrae]